MRVKYIAINALISRYYFASENHLVPCPASSIIRSQHKEEDADFESRGINQAGGIVAEVEEQIRGRGNVSDLEPLQAEIALAGTE